MRSSVTDVNEIGCGGTCGVRHREGEAIKEAVVLAGGSCSVTLTQHI